MSIKKVKKYRVIILILLALNLLFVLYHFSSDGGLYKGELGMCSSVPSEDEEKIIQAKNELDGLLAEEDGAVNVHNSFLATTTEIEDLLVTGEYINKTECEDGLAFVDDVLDFPSDYGVCLWDTESLTPFMEAVSEDEKRASLKTSIASYHELESKIAVFTDDQKESIALAEDYADTLSEYQNKVASNEYCSLDSDDEISSLLSNIHFLSI